MLWYYLHISQKLILIIGDYMPKKDKTVFISYRREESSYVARAIFQDLQKNGYDVFMDVESIDSGKFDTIILNQIKARAHFIVVLTPGTEKRLAQPKDWLGREIEHAIKLKRNVVPILADNFTFESAEPYLNKTLKQLPRFNGITLYYDYFEAGMEKLRNRFLKKPINVSVSETPYRDQEAVQSTINIASKLAMPTKIQFDAEHYSNLGIKNARDGKYDQAIKDFDKPIQLDPEGVKFCHNRGLTYGHLGEYERAINDFDKAIQIDPQCANAYYNRGNTYTALGQYERAIKDFDKAIQINPKYALAHKIRERAYNELVKLNK